MAETILEKDALLSYKEDMITYSIAANIRRAVPLVKDGLKPVQRRILYAMYTDSGAYDSKHMRKSAKIVGDTMGNYHPHGDSSIYDAIAPMANYFECKMPLITPEGNWGNFMGDGPAASRYTECCLSEFGYECVVKETKETPNVVDWSKNFDERRMEPDYFSTKVPLLLINGCYGIGVGMACEVPKHNISEVIAATRQLIKDPSYKVRLIPDHCLPCNIIDTDWAEICDKGMGKYKVRGDVTIGEYKNMPALFVTSLPDRINTSMIVDKLNDMVEKKELPMVKDIIDSSGAGVMKIIIQLRKGSDPQYMKEILYKKTQVEEGFSVNFEVIDEIQPKRFSYTSYLNYFINQRMIAIFRLYCNKLQKIMTRWHQIDAYIKVLESGEIDNIIDMIKKQKVIDDNYTVEYLVKKIKITDLQAKFILGSDIRKLSMGYLKKYKEESKELLRQKAECEDYIIHEETILKKIDQELAEIDAKYGRPRVCKVIKASDDSNIPKGTFKIVVTENNYIRKISETDKAIAVKGDNPNFILKVDNTESILLFDNKGKVFKLPVHKVPITEKNNSGIDIRMIIKGLTANIAAVIYEPTIKKAAKLKISHKLFLTTVTANNYIKKLDLDDFLNVPLSGIIYTKINDDDSVKGIDIMSNNVDVIIYSGHKALRIPMSEVPHYKRASQGVFAMNTNNKINGLSVILPDATHVVVLTTNGKVNKFNISGLERSSRYKAGSSVIKLGKGDTIFGIYGVNDSNVIRVITRNGHTDISVKDIPVSSSVAAGSKLINLKGDSIIRSDVGSIEDIK